MYTSKWVRGRGAFKCKHGCCHDGLRHHAKRGNNRAGRRAARKALAREEDRAD